MRKRIGSLDVIVREGESTEDVVVLLHGFGADMNDLAPLSDVLDPEGQWTFVFPNAPLEVPIGPGWTGRGWFPISLRDLEVGVDFTMIRPPGLDSSRELVSQVLFELNAQRLVLGGFSQGAMVATDVAMTQPQDLAGLVVWSGVLLDQPGWSRKASGLSGKRILQSHGVNDQVLPVAAAEGLNDLLKTAGSEVKFVKFSGQHEIPMPVLKETRTLLKSCLAQP